MSAPKRIVIRSSRDYETLQQLRRDLTDVSCNISVECGRAETQEAKDILQRYECTIDEIRRQIYDMREGI